MYRSSADILVISYDDLFSFRFLWDSKERGIPCHDRLKGRVVESHSLVNRPLLYSVDCSFSLCEASGRGGVVAFAPSDVYHFFLNDSCWLLSDDIKDIIVGLHKPAVFLIEFYACPCVGCRISFLLLGQHIALPVGQLLTL